MKTRIERGVTLMMPEKADCENLKVGDMAMDCFGATNEVVEIFGVGHCQHPERLDNAYVCYYTALGPNNGRISHSMEEGQIIRTLETISKFTSQELNRIEYEMRAV
jgi:hypothetical protein